MEWRVRAVWGSVCSRGAGVTSDSLRILPWPAGGWLKMERSFFLKKRRADFVAGSLSGRVIVAGGLGKDGASGWYCGSGARWIIGALHEQEKELAPCTLPASALFLRIHNSPFLLAWTARVHTWAPM